MKIQTDIFDFLIINNPDSINVRTPNYYSQVYTSSVINTGVLVFIEVFCTFLFFFPLSLYNHHYSKHFLKKIKHKLPKQWKYCKIICSLISSSHSTFNLCKRKKNRVFSEYFLFSVLINKEKFLSIAIPHIGTSMLMVKLHQLIKKIGFSKHYRDNKMPW